MNVTTLSYVQLDYLETMTDGDADMMQTMLDMLIEEIPDEIRKMNETLAQKDWHKNFALVFGNGEADARDTRRISPRQIGARLNGDFAFDFNLTAEMQ